MTLALASEVMSDAVVPAMNQTLSNSVQQEPTLLGIPAEIRISILEYLLLSKDPVSTGVNCHTGELPCCTCRCCGRGTRQCTQIFPKGSRIWTEQIFSYIETDCLSKPSATVNISILAVCRNLRNEGLPLLLRNTVTISYHIWDGYGPYQLIDEILPPRSYVFGERSLSAAVQRYPILRHFRSWRIDVHLTHQSRTSNAGKGRVYGTLP